MTTLAADRLGVLYPLTPVSPQVVVPFAELVRARGAGRLWMGHSTSLDTHGVYAYLAGAGLTVPMGSAVALSPLRHPLDAAVGARTVAALTGHDFVAGYGPGTPQLQQAVRGEPLRRPVSDTEQYVAAVRDVLAGAPAARRGESFVLDGGLEPFWHPPVHLGVGVLREAMARAAGRVADVAITWLTPHDYVREVLVPAMTQAAGSVGRAAPRVVSVVHVVVDRPGRDVEQVAHTATRVHLGAAHYTDMLRRAGRDVHPDDPRAGARVLLERGDVLSGSPQDVAAGLGEHLAAGVDEVVLNTAGVVLSEGVGAALTDLEDVLDACAARRAAPQRGVPAQPVPAGVGRG